MNDNSILDQGEAVGKVVNIGRMKTLYQVCFAIFGLSYGFILLLMYSFNRRDFSRLLRIENENTIAFIVFGILILAIVSFLTAVFFRLKRAYHAPLESKRANQGAAGAYFLLAIFIFLGAWAGFEYLDAEQLGALIGLKKRGGSSEFGYFSLYFFWALAGKYALLGGLRFWQS